MHARFARERWDLNRICEFEGAGQMTTLSCGNCVNSK
jgi:hypothetical protein